MAFPTWIPFFKKNAADNEGTAEKTEDGAGPLTGRRLNDLACFFRPFVSDPFYRLRPPFSHKAAELSLELSQMTYTLDIEPWTKAGWNDFSIQVDDTLQSGLTVASSASGERMRAMMNLWKLHRAKAALSERNPVSQVLSTLRQREKSDTIKAVCMMHPAENGKYLLAIGFMGTGKRLYDWISNFRFTTEEGFHKGFYQLCTYFEQGAESIVFPATAKELGLEKLTLGNVLLEMRSPASRFHLWMAGHSQGGAVMQVFTHRLMTQWGVLPQNMVGYGLASPTVATGAFVYDPASYPLYHILNSDDLVPSSGALVHLGLCMNYPANDVMRSAAYEQSALKADQAAYEDLKPIRDQLTDVESLFLYGAGLLIALREEKGEESLNAMMAMPWAVPMVDKLLTFAGDKAIGWLDALLNQIYTGYEAVLGKRIDLDTVRRRSVELRPIVQKYPLRRLMGGLATHALPPHHLARGDEEGAYSYIIKKDLDALQPFIWVKRQDELPERRYAAAGPEALRGQAAVLPQQKRKAARPSSRQAQPMGVRRTGYTAKRKR